MKHMKRLSVGLAAAVVLLAAPVAIDIGTHGASGLIGSANAGPGGRVCDDGTRPPCNDGGGGGAPPVDFGDLIKLYRNVNGVPNLTTLDGPQAADRCQQPLPSAACDTDVCTLAAGEPDANVAVVPVDPTTCAVTAECAACTEEVNFGRINDARSPDSVFQSQLDDAVVTLATADCVSLDPAGRLVASTFDDTTLDNLAKTIDSPLQNLAIYRQLMLTGFLGDATTPIVLPDNGDSIFDTAARGLGAASDKAGEVNVDLVAYLNQIMGLSDPATPTVLGKLCIDVREEVQGVVQLVQKCFLNYGPDFTTPSGANYLYTRADNFSTLAPSLPFPAYIPEAVPVDGWFEYLTVSDPDVPLFTILQGPILDAVFCLGDPVGGLCLTPASIDPGFTDGNVGGFAQAADDARAVIAYMHENQVPVDFETLVPCTASGAIFYDLSISPQSGLQVPTTYVNGTEREFTVTVANAGPDPANGTVTVTATAAAGGPVPGSPWVNTFTDLAAGSTASFLEPFLVDLGQTTTITWVAEVAADDPGTDPNLANNSVTETTNVRNNAGGGGGGGRGNGNRP